MSDLRKAAEMALEALEQTPTANKLFDESSYEVQKNAIQALRQALAQSKEQGVITYRTGYDSGYMDASVASKREWVELTDEEIIAKAESCNLWGSDCANDVLEFAALISKKLKERNT